MLNRLGFDLEAVSRRGALPGSDVADRDKAKTKAKTTRRVRRPASEELS